MKTPDAASEQDDDLLPEYDLQTLRERQVGPGRTRGPRKAPTKMPTTIRLDPDVLEGLRATGKGWQTRANDALRDWLQRREHR